MDKTETNSKDNSVVILNVISKLVQDIEKKIILDRKKVRECAELKLLKEKCCDKNVIVSLTAFQAINNLVEKRILIDSQTISTLVSLLPSINHYNGLVSAIGNILICDLQQQISSNGSYNCIYDTEGLHHPFIMVLKYNGEKSWFELYVFIQQLIQMEDIKIEDKIKLLRPVFRHVFWDPSWRGSQFQLKLFSTLLRKSHEKEILYFLLENFMWQEIDITYCIFMQDIFCELVNSHQDNTEVLSALTPFLAQVIKWLILSGNNPTFLVNVLENSLKMESSANSIVLYLLTDVIMDTPAVHINFLINICKSIICSGLCNKFVAYKFVAVILNWCVDPSYLVKSLYKIVEEILCFLKQESINWNDQTHKLCTNEYFNFLENSNEDVKFALDLILLSRSWCAEKEPIYKWLKNLKDSNEHSIQLKMHNFIYGIILSENDHDLIDLCLELLFQLINQYKDISFSFLCLMFYRLGKEVDPIFQKKFLFSLPKLAIKKENIPLIVGIIESLKKSSSKGMTPLIIHLYLLLWKFDSRTYTYLHKMLHDPSSDNFNWELNVSKAIALREICRLAPHLHAKDLVSVLSKILNDCDSQVSGLPSGIAIEAVTELCKAYVIDISGTWSAIQPKLCSDRRPQVIVSLCKFFAEIPKLDSSGQKYEKLILTIVPMLWNYTFFKNVDVVRNAFLALSNYSIENLPLKLFPEVYRMNIKLPKEEEITKNYEDVLMLPYVPAECWIQFLEKINENLLKEGGDLLTVVIERELNCIPRGLFFCPPEKSEPLSYSYLPPRCVCRALVECLRKQCSVTHQTTPAFIKQIIRVLSHEYSKQLPPLDWNFLKYYMNLGSEILPYCLKLLAKQGSVSKTAKSMLDDYLKEAIWDFENLEEVVFFYSILPLLCKSVSYYILKNFLENTLGLGLESTLKNNSDHFERILENLTDTLRNKTVQPGHKTLIAKQLERVLVDIPPDHKAMNNYSLCATEFPFKIIDTITSVNETSNVNRDWLSRAVIIRCAIGMRLDIKNPLVWLNELTDVAANLPDEHEFISSKILSVLRSRRDCDHRTWIQELMWRTQVSVSQSNKGESSGVTHFLIDLFVSATVILSGYDFLFTDFNEISTDVSKRLKIYPQSLKCLLNLSDWTELLPKVAMWMYKLSKWKQLHPEYFKAFTQSLLILKDAKCFKDKNASSFLFSLYSVPAV